MSEEIRMNSNQPWPLPSPWASEGHSSSVTVFCLDICEICPLHSKKMQQIHFLENTIVFNTIKYVLDIIENIVFNSEYNSGGVNKHWSIFSASPKKILFCSKVLEVIKVLYIYHYLYKQPCSVTSGSWVSTSPGLLIQVQQAVLARADTSMLS